MASDKLFLTPKKENLNQYGLEVITFNSVGGAQPLLLLFFSWM